MRSSTNRTGPMTGMHHRAKEAMQAMSNDTTPDPGLCATCQHMERAETRRGSVFYRCLRAQTDLSFPKYPPLPVWRCRGYQPQATEGAKDISPG